MAKRGNTKANKGKAQRVLEEIQRTSRIVAARLRLELRPHGITDSELLALTLLLGRDKVSIGELGRELVLTTGARTYLVNRLEKAGYARRLEWADDGRFFLVELTPRGRTFITALLEERNTQATLCLRGLSASEQSQLYDLLGKVAEAADRYPRPGRVQ